MFNGIDVFWISKANGERYNYMNCQMDRFVPNAVHIVAQDGELHILEKRVTSLKKGCLRSHILALRAARERMQTTGRNFSLIFEDDVSVERAVSLYRPSLMRIIDSLPPDWEIIQLGYHTNSGEWNNVLRSPNLLTRKYKLPIFALMSYLVSRKAVDEVWRNTRIDSNGTVRVLRKCGTSADGCIMNGMISRRVWNGWFATPPVFWEPTYNGRVLFGTTVGSDSYKHTKSSKMSSDWANRRFKTNITIKYTCEYDVRRLRLKRDYDIET